MTEAKNNDDAADKGADAASDADVTAGAAANSETVITAQSETDTKTVDKAETKAMNTDGSSAKAAKTPPLLSDAIETPRKETPRKTGRGIAWLALLLSLVSLGGVGFLAWQGQPWLVQTQNSGDDESGAAESVQAAAPVEIDTTLRTDLERYNRELAAGLADNRMRLAQQQERVDEVAQRMLSTRRQLADITQVSRQSWMLAEAEYLLRLGNQRLIMEREGSSALALLQSADQILQRVDDVNLYPVRAALASEIASLRAVAELDVEGVYLELAALSDQVGSLEMIVPEGFASVAEAEENESEQPEPAQSTFEQIGSTLSSTLNSTLNKFSHLIRIQKREAPQASLLSSEQLSQLKQSLQMMLEQSKLALLQRREGLYRHSLETAAEWIEEYFNLNQSAVTMVSRLKLLAQQNIAPPLPDISRSLNLLKDYLKDPERSGVMGEEGVGEQDIDVSNPSALIPAPTGAIVPAEVSAQ